MGEARSLQPGEFKLDESWQYLLDLHQRRQAESYVLYFKSPTEGEDQSSFQMQHHFIEPERYLFKAVRKTKEEAAAPTDLDEYGLFIVDEGQRIGKLAVLKGLDTGASLLSALDWISAQEEKGLDIPNSDELQFFRRIFTDLSQEHPVSR